MPGLAVLAVALLLAGWALTIILSPPGAAAEITASATVTVVEGEVGEQLSLNVAAEWQASPVATNEAAGIVTSVDAQPGATTGQGGRLYSVDGRPVVAAQGDVPAYRALGIGSSGDDAAQLQRMLADLGFYSGPADGVIGTAASSAIEQWQKSLGLEPTGVVDLGDVVFVQALPARLTVAPGIVERGARLSGGEHAVLALGASPVFTLPVGENQSARVTTGARVEITAPDGSTWMAAVAGRAPAPTGSTVVLSLAVPSAAPATAPATAPAVSATTPAASTLCGDTCSMVPTAGQTLLPARVVTVETARGPVVPSVALRSDAQQRLSLLDDRGVEHPVTIVASARGMSVVAGVHAGMVARIPDTDSGLTSPAVPNG